ncbi:DNA-binding protein HU-beta [Clostridiales Family XIII bacterium PM5-7]
MKELINKVAEANGISKQLSKEVCKSVFEILAEELAVGNTVKINKFGIFEVRVREARQGFNPNTREKLELPEKKYPWFKSAKALKDIVSD